MSTKYKISDEVPSALLVARLKELSDAVTRGKKGVDREFYMSIPAQVDTDADLVLCGAAKRIEALEAKHKALIEEVRLKSRIFENVYDALFSETELAKMYVELDAKHNKLVQELEELCDEIFEEESYVRIYDYIQKILEDNK